MRKLAAVLVAATLPLAGIAATSADDPPEGIDHLIEVAKGDTQKVSAAGGTGGVNLTSTAECASDSYNATCEKTLVKFVDGGAATTKMTPNYPSDFDLEVFTSDETGALGESVGSSATRYTPVAAEETVAWDVKAGEWYVVVVKYFVGGGGYSMTVGVS